MLIVGHTDTVPLQGHVGARVEDGRLFGLGATDMKAGLAVMIHLLEDVGTSRAVGIFYAGEEGPMAGNELGPILDALPALESAEAVRDVLVRIVEELRIAMHCAGAGSVTDLRRLHLVVRGPA